MIAARLEIAVKPGSKHPGITIVDDVVVLRVRERAVEGAANKACIEALSAALRVAPSAIELLRGEHSRRKLLLIHDATITDVFERLRAQSAQRIGARTAKRSACPS